VSEELVPASVYQALMTVRGLRRGHPGTYDKPKVKPVPQQHVEAVLPFLCPQVAAMVQLQPLLGARPSEVCVMRGRDIDRSGPVWWYRIDPNEVPREGPTNLHKTAHVEGADGSASVKLLPIGPKAQAILKDWLRENADEYLFQPREARQARYAERRKRRTTPLWRSHVEHQARKKKAEPKRAPRDHYDRYSYAHAIARACRKAGVPHWHPHQLYPRRRRTDFNS
jgi:integrase